MKKRLLLYTVLCLGNLVLFITAFFLFQNEKVYRNTLGKISMTYERTGAWSDFNIQLVRKPFTSVTEQKLLHWDSEIYYSIKEYMYSDEGPYSGVRGAFFPLFPGLWKTTQLSAIGICLLNYLLFASALILLVELLLKEQSLRDRLFFIGIALSVPSVVFFYIPYTEAVFLITSVCAVAGFIKKKYTLYFLGAFLVATTRPASMFVGVAIILIDVLVLWLEKDWRGFLKNTFLKILPFAAGYFSVVVLMYFYQGSWTLMYDARKYWPEETLGMRLPGPIRDWSVEGFGMSSFSIAYICLPAIVYVLFKAGRVLLAKHKDNLLVWLRNEDHYLAMISLAYMGLLLIYTLLFRGGSLNSFSRYTLASPFFFLLLLQLWKQRKNVHLVQKILLLVLPSIFLYVFFKKVEYGDGRLRFEYMGMYLFILLLGFVYLHTYLNRTLQVIGVVGIFLLNILWSTYLFNCFLCDSWIFT